MSLVRLQRYMHRRNLIKNRRKFLISAIILVFLTAIIIGVVFVYSKEQQINADMNTEESIDNQPAEIVQKESLPEPKPIPKSESIPIVMYHHIRDYDVENDSIGTNLSLSPSKFEEQLAWLKNNGYKTITFDNFSSGSDNKSIILTFDDGYKDAYTNAYPLLKKYGFSGVFYIITSFIGRDDTLAESQIKEMSVGGMIIGSHTQTHIDLEKSTVNTISSQLSESKNILENITGAKITDFCYPSGRYNEQSPKNLENSGFKTAVTTESPTNADQFSNLFLLPRIRINHNDSINSFTARIGKFPL